VKPDTTVPRLAAGAAFGLVLAVCVLLALLLWSVVAVPGTGMSAGVALGIASGVGLVGGAGFGWALSRWGWIPQRPAPPQETVPPPGEEDPVRKRARTSGWIAGTLSGLFSGPFAFLAVALPFAALSVEGRSLSEAVLLTVLLSAVLGTLVGVGVFRSLLRRDSAARFGPGPGSPLHAPGRPSPYTAPMAVRREAVRAITQGRLTGDPATDRAAWDVALEMVRIRVSLVALAPLFWVFVLFLPQGLEHLRQDGPTPYVALTLGMSVLLLLLTVGSLVLRIRQRKQARRFLALFEEAAARM
jgi:hypothetical protein